MQTQKSAARVVSRGGLVNKSPSPQGDPSVSAAVADTEFTTAQRIAALEADLAELRQLQRLELVAAISVLIGPGIVFSAVELWERQVLSPDLNSALFNAGIRSPRQLGKRLRQLCYLDSGARRVSAPITTARCGLFRGNLGCVTT